ncbi:MAG: hypothetical protein IBJ03_13200 [Gemmatimonadaceae bacterium]|nr:hypothetical protein [Gemmatimonadaceae bacterium]
MTDFLDLHDDAHARRLVLLAAILMLTVPFLQAGAQLWPLQLTNIQWRFQAANFLSSLLLLPFLGTSILVLVGRGLESKPVSLFAGAVSALFALGLAGSLVVFVLDAQQLQAIVTSAMSAAFRNATVRVGLVTTLFFLGFSYLTLVSFLKSRATAPASRSKGSRSASNEADEDVGLIIGVHDKS